MASQQPFQQSQFPPPQPQILQPPVSNGIGQPPPNTRFSAPPTSTPNYSSQQPLNRPPIPGQGSAFAPIGQSTNTSTSRDQLPYSQPGYGIGVGKQQPPQPGTQPVRPPGVPVMSPGSSGPPSNQTSTNPSPIPSMSFDRMEGQFPLNGAASPAGSTSNLYQPPQTTAGVTPSSNLNGPQCQFPNFSQPATMPMSPSYPASNVIRPQQPGFFQAPPSNAKMPPTVGPPATTSTTQPPINGGYTGMSNGPPPASGPPTWNTPYSPNMAPQPQGQAAFGSAAAIDPRRQYPQPNYPPSVNQAGAPYTNFNPAMDKMATQMGSMSVTNAGYDKLWGRDNVDLLQVRNILPSQGVETPKIYLRQDHMTNANCSPDIFRCTLTKIPESNSILQKSRLPLGVLIHPFKDLTSLPVIQCQTIVRCRSCRTYINPFVYFVDQRRWKCNLCFRVNDLPDEFHYDPMSNSYGDPTRRPEIKNATIEFIAPSEYMLRAPQPAVYLYLLDVSHAAVDNGYLKLFCDIMLEELDKIPGDSRTQIGFITYDSSVHFYNLAENLNQPHQLIVSDIDDIFLPCPNDLLVNLNESKRLVVEFLKQLPRKFTNTPDCNSALGAALQAAYKMVNPIGGRVTVFQVSLPNVGPGALKPREDPNQRAGKDVPNLNAATDFYKKFALDCSGQQVAVDLFLLGGQYMDIASLSCVSKYSGGCMYHFPGFHYVHNTLQVERLEHSLRRYLTRKIGFESVMRIRCTHGLSIHTFHGNFFVRSTDLLSLPNINPDAGFGLQVSIDENLSEVQQICFQAALLYTSSKGERRIRVHTLCLPIASTVAEVIQSADQQCIVGLLAKMAVDRSLHASISDARDALVNVCVDVLSAYKATLSSSSAGLYAPSNLRLLPLYVAALLKSVAFRTGQSTRLDDRVFAMNQMKVLPLSLLILSVYPDLYAIHNLNDQGAISQGDMIVPQPPRLHLSAEMVDSTGAYLLDTGDVIYMYVGRNIHPTFLNKVLDSPSFQALPQHLDELPELETHESERLRNFIIHLQNQRPYPAVLQLIKEDSQMRNLFTSHLVDGRTESSLSYYEFLQHIKTQVK